VCNDAVDPGSFEPEYKIAAVKIKRVSGPVKLVERYIISDVNEKFYIVKKGVHPPFFFRGII